MTRGTIARLVSALLNPGILLGAFLAMVALREPVSLRIASAAIAIMATTLVPMAAVVVLRHRRVLSDLDMRVREERGPVYAVALASYACGIAVLVSLGARWVPGALTLQLAVACGAAGLNRYLKVSIHMLVLAGISIGALVLAGRGAWPILVTVPLAGWARWAAGAHTPAELATGAALGAGSAAAGFTALKALLAP